MLNKQFYGILLTLLVLTFLVSACTNSTTTDAKTNAAPTTQNTQQTDPTQTAQTTNNQNTQTTPGTTGTEERLGMGKLYNYGALKNYEYKITSTASGNVSTMNLKYSISTDTLDSKSVWLSQSEVTTDQGTIITKQWLDKTTYSCIKMLNSISVGGQSFDTPVDCPNQGPNAASAAVAPEFVCSGQESVTIPKGTYNAKKCTLEGMTYWYSGQVPVPLKTLSNDGSSMMELVSYS